MHFQEQVRVEVPRAVAWDFLWQTERLAACLPGCTGVEVVQPDLAYRVQFEDHIGPYRVHFDLQAVVQEALPGERVRLFCSGEDRRLGAAQRVTLDVTLRALEPSATQIDVSAEVEVLGRLAALGQFAIKRKAKDVVRQFAANIQAALAPSQVGGAERC
jgi:carbon monoxide dehydrogenase subunit G